jgi:hypothetical protein
MRQPCHPERVFSAVDARDAKVGGFRFTNIHNGMKSAQIQLSTKLPEQIYRKRGQGYAFKRTHFINGHIHDGRRTSFGMLFFDERSRDGARARSYSRGSAPSRAGFAPGRRRPTGRDSSGNKPNDHHELGQRGRRAEKDYDICRWNRAEAEHDNLEQW